MKTRSSIEWIGIEGALMTLSPLPLLFSFTGTDGAFPPLWRLLAASAAVMACFICGLMLFRRQRIGKFLGMAAAAGSFAAAFPFMSCNPFAALSGSVMLISIILILIDFRIKTYSGIQRDHIDRCLQRAWWGALVTPLVVILDIILGTSVFTVYVIAAVSIIAQILVAQWAVEKKAVFHLLLPLAGLTSIGLAFYSALLDDIANIVIVISLLSMIFLPRGKMDLKSHSWDIFFNHPARIMLTTFLSLCLLGTFLLILPVATEAGAIDLVDAVFTSVSAVCVTGLIVLDTSRDFTLFGQFFILLLIQLGGLGIMSITTVALHVMGRRLSLKQERLLTWMTDTDHKDLLHSLATILKFTFAIEGTGAFLLTAIFYSAGDAFADALWRGVFTSISAFCNAGFALQNDSLIPYQTNSLVLHVVAVLIIFGGIAPATSLIVPRWLTGKQIPIPARISLITTVILLFSGTFFIVAFEWGGVLAGLSFENKIQNAWFQSVTLRTAGFNSVDIAGITNPTFLLMVFFMFIGGSPGGTAGGVKTTTIGILAMTFWANITNRNDVITQNRRIPSHTVYRAITIVASGMVVWFLVVLMLEATQQISARDLVFEATSAIGTVGLSTGATSLLDGIGKIIIIIAMFVGRIGPMTLFMLLSDEQAATASRCPNAKISLT